MSEELWNQLETICKGCRKCPLGATRTNLVFGTGNRTADLLFVGEAPGQAEDEQGIPFVGAAFETDTLRGLVTQMEKRRVTQIRVWKKDVAAEDAAVSEE